MPRTLWGGGERESKQNSVDREMREEEIEDHLESLLPEGTTVTVERRTPQAFLQPTGFLSWGEG